MCVDHIPSPLDNAKRKIEHIYTGPMDTDLAEEMALCEAEVRITWKVYIDITMVFFPTKTMTT